jgi:hypothetical protein
MTRLTSSGAIPRTRGTIALRYFLLATLAGGGLACERLAGPPQYATVVVATNETDGTPVPDVPVSLVTGDRSIENARTDSRGRYVFERVPPGPFNYGVTATIPAAYRDSGESAFMVEDRLDVVAGAPEPVRFTLSPCIGTVSVSVSDQSSRPAAGLALRLYGVGEDDAISTIGPDGTHRFTGVRCGEYGVQLLPTPGFVIANGRGLSFVDGIRIHRGAALAVRLTLQSCAGDIRIFVHDAAGAGVPGARVSAYSASGNLATINSGADGRVLLAALPCGADLGVAIVAPAGYSVATGRGTSFFDGLRVTNGGTLDLDFTLSRP